MALPHTHHQRARSTGDSPARGSRCVWTVPWAGEGARAGVCVRVPFPHWAWRGPPFGACDPCHVCRVRVSQKTGLLSKFWKDSACSGLWPTPVLLGADWDTWEAWPWPCGLQGEVTILSLPVVTRSQQGARSHSEV